MPPPDRKRQNLVNLEAVTAHVPGDASRVLLDGVSLGVDRGDRIGVVGLNGGGKTTLLDILTGERAPDGGRVSRRADLRLAHLAQTDALPPGVRVRDVVLARYGAEHEWAADAKVRDVLDGLGIAPRSAGGTVVDAPRSAGGAGIDTPRSAGGAGIDTVLDRPVEGLSGGEKRRVGLAATLIGEPDLVVLDEPTNHLDVEGIGWLAEHLLGRRCGLVVVTHDRWFLDTVCSRTWEVAGGRVEGYDGGYADWVFARAERVRQSDAAEARRRNLARKELAWLRRGPPARTSKPRFRIEAAEALIADVPPPRDRVELQRFATTRLGRTVLELEDATVRIPARSEGGARIDSGRTLLDGVTWRLGPGDRVAIVGVNGSGKTTLLRALTGERPLDGGRRVQGSTVQLAQLTQELPWPARSARPQAGADLPGELRVLEATEAVAQYVRFGRDEMTASQVLERLGFPASRQWTPVGQLSGGERRRLQLTRLLMASPNVLLLDEPTNDLDVDTLANLEDLLDGWPGTLVVVSHDRYLVERACDTVVALLGDGRLTHLPGGIEEYLRRRAAVTAPAALGRVPARQNGQVAARSGGAEQRTARKEAQRLERRMESLARCEKELHAALAEAATEPERLLALDAELRGVVAEREQAEADWLEAAEQAEG